MQTLPSSEKRFRNYILAFSRPIAQDVVAELTFQELLLLSKLAGVCYTTLEAGEVRGS